MATFKRILSGILIVVSILGLILCLAGIIAVWVFNTSLTDNLTASLDRAAFVLDFSQVRLDQAETNLSETLIMLASVEDAATKAEENLSENSPTLALISNTVGVGLKPKIDTIAEMIGTLRGTIISVNDTLETANSIPFVSVPTLPMEQLAAIDLQMQEMVTTANSLGDAVRDIETGVVNFTAAMIMVPVDKLTGIITRVQIPVKTFSTTLAQIETAVVSARERIPVLIDWGSVLFSFLFAWFILAQASLFYGGWYYWKTGTIPAIKIVPLANPSGG